MFKGLPLFSFLLVANAKISAAPLGHALAAAPIVAQAAAPSRESATLLLFGGALIVLAMAARRRARIRFRRRQSASGPSGHARQDQSQGRAGA